MTAQPLGTPDFANPQVNGDGRASIGLRQFMTNVFKRLGGTTDKVEAAFQLASGATTQTTEVVAGRGLTGGGPLVSNIAIQFGLGAYTVALLPAGQTLQFAYAIDGRKNGEASGAGTGTWVWWDNANWIAFDSGAPVAA